MSSAAPSPLSSPRHTARRVAPPSFDSIVRIILRGLMDNAMFFASSRGIWNLDRLQRMDSTIFFPVGEDDDGNSSFGFTIML